VSPNASPVAAGAQDFAEAQRLAVQGRCRCRGPCKKEFPVTDVITVQYGSALVIALCKDCFMHIDVILQRAVNGIEVRLVARQGIIVRG
jgi:hypothetical protein